MQTKAMKKDENKNASFKITKTRKGVVKIEKEMRSNQKPSIVESLISLN